MMGTCERCGQYREICEDPRVPPSTCTECAAKLLRHTESHDRPAQRSNCPECGGLLHGCRVCG